MRVPRFARTVADELRLMGDFDGLNQRLDRYLAHTSTNALRHFVLNRLADEFAKPPGRVGLCADVFACLLCVPHGLREAELLAASNCPPVVWSVLLPALGELLVRRGELLTFADADVAKVARGLCSAAHLTGARDRLERHYALVATRELRSLREDASGARTREQRERRGLPPLVPSSPVLLRALRQRMALLVAATESSSRNALIDTLLDPQTFDVVRTNRFNRLSFIYS